MEDHAKRPIDRRVARTRATLEKALYALILEKGYEAITVDNICERANVGRSTFYAHYMGKDDLKRSGLQHLRAMLVEQQKRAGRTDQPWEFSLAIFEHARDHLELYKALVGGHGGAIALGTVRQIVADMVRGEVVASMEGTEAEAIPRDIVVHYVVGGFMALLTWWLDGGAKLPPDRIDSMFKRLTVEGTKFLNS